VTRRAVRGPWAALTLPQKRLRIQSNVVGGEGWVSPLWGFLIMEGAPRRGNPKGETKAGEERHGMWFGRCGM